MNEHNRNTSSMSNKRPSVVHLPVNTQLKLKATNHQHLTHPSQSQNALYNTLRAYTQRLKQQKDQSLKYLEKINELSEELRKKDNEIKILKKQNKQISDKLGVYQNVLNRSRIHATPLRMSTVIDKEKMMQSIIQIKTLNEQNYQSPLDKRFSVSNKCLQIPPCGLFQQFFIVTNNSQSSSQTFYRYQFIQNDPKFRQIVGRYVMTQDLVIKPYQANTMKSKSTQICFICDSSLTLQKNKNRPNYALIDKTNLSYYYYGFAIIDRQLTSINGKYYWVPTVFGFLTLLPVAEIFFKLLQNIIKDHSAMFGNYKILQQSLLQLNSKYISTVITEINPDKLFPNFRIQMPFDINYVYQSKVTNFRIKSFEHLQSMLFSYPKEIFKNYAPQLIVDVFMLLLLEIPITVTSEDSNILSKFMLYFIFLIRPLKYPFPIVFDLQPSMQILLESPFPTFLGSKNKAIAEKYMNERAIFDLDEKVAKSWPNLTNLDVCRDYLMEVVKKNKGDVIKSSLVQQIIKNGKTNKCVQPYWRDFTKTQIYQEYLHDLEYA